MGSVRADAIETRGRDKPIRRRYLALAPEVLNSMVEDMVVNIPALCREFDIADKSVRPRMMVQPYPGVQQMAPFYRQATAYQTPPVLKNHNQGHEMQELTLEVADGTA